MSKTIPISISKLKINRDVIEDLVQDIPYANAIGILRWYDDAVNYALEVLQVIQDQEAVDAPRG